MGLFQRRATDLFKDPKKWNSVNDDAPNWTSDSAQGEVSAFRGASDDRLRAITYTNRAGIDFSFAKPPVTEIKRANYEWVVGYTSMIPEKNLTRAYIESCVASGIRVTLVGQDGKSDPLGGYDRGVARAKEYFRQARALGYPADAVHFFATDFEPTAAQLSGPVSDFYRGVRDVAKAEGRQVGNYGSDVVCNHLYRTGLVKWCWQTKAWSYGRISPYASFVQYAGHAGLRPRMSSGNWDENLWLKEWPRMGDPKPSPVAPPVPPPLKYGILSAPIVGAASHYPALGV